MKFQNRIFFVWDLCEIGPYPVVKNVPLKIVKNIPATYYGYRVPFVSYDYIVEKKRDPLDMIKVIMQESM